MDVGRTSIYTLIHNAMVEYTIFILWLSVKIVLDRIQFFLVLFFVFWFCFLVNYVTVKSSYLIRASR